METFITVTDLLNYIHIIPAMYFWSIQLFSVRCLCSSGGRMCGEVHRRVVRRVGVKLKRNKQT